MRITLGHTHDADDAFMFHAILNGRIDTEGLVFEDRLEPMAALNEKARVGAYHMTALSVASLPHVAEGYDVLTSGSCMAEERGPLLCLRKNLLTQDIAVPGLSTSACLAAQLYKAAFHPVPMPFDRILPALESAEIDGGVLISEDQMRVDRERFNCVDLGEWWNRTTGLPLPLGIDVVAKSLAMDTKRRICRVFRRSIRYALENPNEAWEYAMGFGRGIGREDGMKFVGTFVNAYAVDMGERGKEAILSFLRACHEANLIAPLPRLEFIQP